MSENKTQETHSRGALAPQKGRWNDESQDSQSEEEMPRKNRQPRQPKAPFKAKFVPRQSQQLSKQDSKHSNDDFKYKKDNTRNKNNDKEYDREDKKNTEREYEKYQERNYEKKDQPREKPQKREVGKGIDRTNNSRRPQNNKDSELDYSVEELPRRPRPHYTNELQIVSSDSDAYVKDAQRMLNKFDFITLVGIDDMVGQAFNIAEIICHTVKNLDRVNIPSTDRVEEILHPKKEGLVERRRTRYIPIISIELSKNQLMEKHIGYQTYKKTNTTNPKKEYKEKDQEKQKQ